MKTYTKPEAEVVTFVGTAVMSGDVGIEDSSLFTPED